MSAVRPSTAAASQTRPSRPQIAVIDYGMGNRRSAEKALLHAGADAFTSRDPRQLQQADGLLLPGVGAFPAAMEVISQLRFDELLREQAQLGTPLFGSCMGMQLLFDSSSEHGGAQGLGLLSGEVKRLDGEGLKLPHIGWSEVVKVRECPLWEGLPERIFLYHVHSYVAHPGEPQIVAGVAEYGESFPALVACGNIFGAQSHPEKSSAQGLRVLSNFVSVCAARAKAHAASPR